MGSTALLHVDLGSRRVWREPFEQYGDLIGGRGLNIALLFRSMDAGVDPLGPENVLVFSTGPVAGTLAPSSARYTVSARSPLTGFIGDSNSGGFWAPELRCAGYDGIVLYGRCDRPAYLLIADDRVQILDAADIWGRDTWQTTDILKQRHRDHDLKVACIGIAGENLVKFACIMNDYSRAAGRTGLGAVMGSKNLKAIAVRGRRGVRVARPGEFHEVCRRLVDTIRKSRQFDLYHHYGVLGGYGDEDSRDDSPGIVLAGFKYHTASVLPHWGRVRGKDWWKAHWTKVRGCSGCQMHCAHFYSVRSGPFAGVLADGPEGEPATWLTSNLGGTNKDVAAFGYARLNQLGIDANEMCGVIGLVMCMYDRGVITDRRLKELGAGFLRPVWGDAETILSLIEMTARREGIGRSLAEGPLPVARHIGKDAEYLVIHGKGMVPAGDKRGHKGGLLNQMVSTRGADHLRGQPTLGRWGDATDDKLLRDWTKYAGEPELLKEAVKLSSYGGKAPLVIWQEQLRTLSDCFGVCSFNYGNWPNTSVYPEDFAELFAAATGAPCAAADMVRAAHRTVNLEKAFNIREGWTREDDQPPPRWSREARRDGLFKGQIVDLDKFNEMLDDYYVRRGWDRESGLPVRRNLEGLGLRDVADALEKIGKLADTPLRPLPRAGAGGPGTGSCTPNARV